MSDPDDVTLWAGRLRPWPASGASDPDAEGDSEGDGETRIVRRRAAAPGAPTADAPAAADGPALPDPAAPPADTELVAHPPDDAGERTVVAEVSPTPRAARHPDLRPTTRRAASGRIAAPADTPRNARVPTGAARELYPPRTADPVIVPRVAPATPTEPPRPAPDYDAALRRARARRVRMLVIAVSAGIAALAASAGVVVLLAL